VKDVWPIAVHEHARFVETVVSVSADVRPAINDQDRLLHLTGDALRQYTACKACPDDQPVKHILKTPDFPLVKLQGN
jgi:hypothetical protein